MIKLRRSDIRKRVEKWIMGFGKLLSLMKKIIGLLSTAVVFGILSCADQPAETKKEVIVVPATVEKKEPVVVVKDSTKPTSVTVDKGGVKVESKKVNVDVHPNQ